MGLWPTFVSLRATALVRDQRSTTQQGDREGLWQPWRGLVSGFFGGACETITYSHYMGSMVARACMTVPVGGEHQTLLFLGYSRWVEESRLIPWHMLG